MPPPRLDPCSMSICDEEARLAQAARRQSTTRRGEGHGVGRATTVFVFEPHN
jgi:hypothetical protein